MKETVRLTTAQALVRWMIAQRSELLDGTEVPLFAGVFGIFGHGNVLGLGTALYDVRDALPTWRGQNEQGMALAAVAYARATDRRQVMAATSSVGPGALNMVTAAEWPTRIVCRSYSFQATRSPDAQPTLYCSRSSTSAIRPSRSTTHSARCRATSTGSRALSNCCLRFRRSRES